MLGGSPFAGFVPSGLESFGTARCLCDYPVHSLEERPMKLTTISFALVLALPGTVAHAQSGTPSGRGSVTGDPAASSATPSSSPTTGSSMKPNPSGSGTSTSGGSDANGDQGRDKMPETQNEKSPKKN
jgi:hypothetical protein